MFNKIVLAASVVTSIVGTAGASVCLNSYAKGVESEKALNNAEFLLNKEKNSLKKDIAVLKLKINATAKGDLQTAAFRKLQCEIAYKQDQMTAVKLALSKHHTDNGIISIDDDILDY